MRGALLYRSAFACTPRNCLEITQCSSLATAAHVSQEAKARDQIRNLCRQYGDDVGNAKHLMENAFAIYETYKAQANSDNAADIINDLLQLCVRHKYLKSNQIASLWTDIDALCGDRRAMIALPSLLHCMYNQPHSTTIQVLQWMKMYGFDLRQNEREIIALIVKCKRDWSALQTIHSLLDDHEDAIDCKRCLIQQFGRYHKRNGYDLALQLFESIDEHRLNADILNAVMTACVYHFEPERALNLYQTFARLHDNKSQVLAIKACTNIRDTCIQQQWFETVMSASGDALVHSHDVYITTALINYYGVIGDTDNAAQIFDASAQRNSATYNAMMTAFLKNECAENALRVYDAMPSSQQDDVSHLIALRACIQSGDFDKGELIHAHIRPMKISVELQSVLMAFYGHFGRMEMADTIFHGITHKNSAFVGVMMKACIHNACYDQALSLYRRYQSLQNNITHVLAIRACTESDRFEIGDAIHTNVQRKDVQLKNTLIGFYGHFQRWQTAQSIFDSIENATKDVFSISAMMQCLCDCGEYEKCLDLFQNIGTIATISVRNIKSDSFCYAIALKACAETTAFHFGVTIDAELKQPQNKHIRADLSVQINLIDWYGKCAMLDAVNELFEEIKQQQTDRYCKEITIWNAVLKAFARNGDLDRVRQSLNGMRQETALTPDRKTWIIVLNACNHCSDIDSAEHFWKHEINDMEIQFDGHVVTTLVNGYVKAQKLQQAKEIIEKYEAYSNQPVRAMWTCLLNGYRQQTDVHEAQAIYLQFCHRFSVPLRDHK